MQPTAANIIKTFTNLPAMMQAVVWDASGEYRLTFLDMYSGARVGTSITYYRLDDAIAAAKRLI